MSGWLLTLDDDPKRHKGLYYEYCGSLTNQVMAYTFSQFKQALSEREYDLICLDYDLDHYGTPDYKEGRIPFNGLDAVNFLIKNKIVVAKIRIHSCNPQGSHLMEQALLNAGYDVEKRIYTVREETIDHFKNEMNALINKNIEDGIPLSVIGNILKNALREIGE